MQLSQEAFQTICRLVHELCGILIAPDKQYLVKSRLEPILRRNDLPSYEALIERLRRPNVLQLQDQIVEAITTKETSFNRDAHPFEELRRTILPELASRLIERKISTGLAYPRCRIWCAAVATGQEAYSVAMAISDFLAARTMSGVSADDFPILATDISQQALNVAREGKFTAAELGRGIAMEQRDKYFRPNQDGTWVVQPAIRRMIEFRQMNLAQPFMELGGFDLILCRNILIYFDEALRRRLCQGFYSALNPRGLLMIGAAESLYGVNGAFKPEQCGRTVVYRKP